jgi:hypothetical protein
MNSTTTGFGWLSLALVNAGLAQNKGRSAWYWFLFSIFIGPLATFLIVVWPSLSETAKAPATSTPNTAASAEN